MSPQDSTIVVVGGGQAASQCCVSLRALGHRGPLTLVSEEPMLPYCRPPLSKSWLVGEQTAEWLLYRPADFYTRSGIDTRLDQPARHIDKERRTVTLASGEQLPYDGLALALGSRVRKLSVPGHDLPQVCYIRGHADVQAIRNKLPAARRVVVVGGGFIGLEAAAVLVKTGRTVTLLASSAALLPRAGIGVVAAHLLQYHRARGVDVRLQSSVQAVESRGEGGVIVRCDDGSLYPADLVIVGIGIAPETDLAERAGLACNDGIVVDEHGRTSDARIVAAGDCTRHPNALSGRQVRLETVHNAVEQAKCAAATLVGLDRPYRQVPWVWSDQYDLRLQSVGLWQDHDEWVQRGDPRNGHFSLYYFRQGRFIAMESVNQPAQFGACRRLLNEGVPLTPAQAADPGFDLRTLLVNRQKLTFEKPWPSKRPQPQMLTR